MPSLLCLRWRIPAVLMVCGGLLAATVGRSQTPLPEYDLTAVRAQFSSNLALYGLGLNVQIEQRGRPLLAYQAGPLGPQTRIGIASCTKWLSGAIVLILAERGYFDLDDPVGRYLPEFAAAGKGHPTIRQCFAMTSGFYSRGLDYETDRTLTLAQSVALIAQNTPIVFEPGTQLAYEGDGMQIVGRICEVVTGQAWTTLAEELLFRPLGMTRTTYDFFDLNPAIAGGARSTVSDYLSFLRMLLANGVAPDGRVVMSTRSIEIFFTNQSYGLPVFASPWPGDNGVGGSGDYGMGSWILTQPDETAPVEEVTSPGAFGSFPWIDRRRGIIGMALGFTAGGSAAHQNTMQAITLLREEVDAVGLPHPGAPGPLVASRALGTPGSGTGYLRLDWTGGGELQTSTDLQTWTPWPFVHSPFVENLERLPSQRQFFRVVWE